MEIDGVGAYRRRRRGLRYRRRGGRRMGYRRRYRGRGGYGRDIGSAVGEHFGGSLGGRVGGALGNLASRRLGKLIGRGSYQNSLVTDGGVAPEVPSFSSSRDETGALRISHREYVRDIFGDSNVSFNSLSVALNPGIAENFPWLSQIACNYEEYEWVQLMFTYRSTVTDIGSSTNGQCGTVIMCTNYNADQPAFYDKHSMMEYDGAMSCKTTESMIHGIECDPSKLSGSSGKYVRTGPPPITEDLKTYDQGLFQLATANVPSGLDEQQLGELWVSYTIILRKPRFFVNRGLAIEEDIFVSQDSAAPNVRYPFGNPSTPLIGQLNNIGCVITSTFVSPDVTITIEFPPNISGLFSIFFNMAVQNAQTPGFNSFAWSVPAGSGCVKYADIYGAWDGQADNDSPVDMDFHYSDAFMMLKASLYVTPQVGSVKNIATINWKTSASSPVNQTWLQITRKNPQYFLNSRGQLPPQFVNSSQVVTVPT